MADHRWYQGEPIVVREMWLSRVWSAWPAIVVCDDPELLMLFIPAMTNVKYAVDATTGQELRLYRDDWVLVDAQTRRPLLSFTRPGDRHATMAFWDEDWRLTRWYINLETCVARTATTYDFVDHCLDVVVAPDRSSWEWKDEDELEEAIARGIFTTEDAALFRAEGERAAQRLIDGDPPFDRDWSTWRPDPSWPRPDLSAFPNILEGDAS